MTVKNKIMQIVHSDHIDMDADSMEKLVRIAYWMGRESATKEINDKYKDLIAMQKKRAEKTRYKHLAKVIIGQYDYVYCSEYDGMITKTFGNDITNL